MLRINTSQKIVIPKKWDKWLKSHDLLANLNSISDNDIQNIWDDLESWKKNIDEAREYIESHELKENVGLIAEDYAEVIWNKGIIDKKKASIIQKKEKSLVDGISESVFKRLLASRKSILNDLKKNYVKIEDCDMYWHMWKIVHLELPKIWKSFDWFKSDFFISNDKVRLDMLKFYWFEDDSFTKDEFVELLDAVNSFLKACCLKNDWDMDYEKDIDYWRYKNFRCKAWNFLKDLLWLNGFYWLKGNYYIDWKDRHLRFDCNDFSSSFVCCSNSVYDAFLMLKLPK